MQKRGRKRLNPVTRLRIVQIRASNPDYPPSIDKILEQLSREGLTVSRGSVQTIIKEWESPENEEIRHRDLPFEWHRLERARIPWEASRWVLECQADYQRLQTVFAVGMRDKGFSLEEITQALASTGVFTNRWATWVWRVHQARPDWGAERTSTIASLYVYTEQAQDLLPDHPALYPRGVQGLLAHQPDRWHESELFTVWGIAYLYGTIEVPVIESLPNLDELKSLLTVWKQVPNLGDLERSGGDATATGLSLWFDSWTSSLFERADQDQNFSEELRQALELEPAPHV